MDNEAASRVRQDIEKLIKSYSDLKKSKNDKEMASISEANVRADYVDRLFGILGWNIGNPDEYDREHFIRGAGFADVALKLNNKPVIFVEAKRFGGISHSKDIKGDWTLEERQSILYALSKNCKWAILTNFEKIRVFNVLTGLTILNLESVFDYKDRFSDLLYLTKEAVESGRIEKLGAREEKPDIDLEFLKMLNKWRIELANDIYVNNFLNEGKTPDLSKLFPDYKKHENDPKYAKFLESRREILRNRLDFSVLKDEKGNFDIERLKSAVQRILDRLIIIRWAEDRLLLDDPNILDGKLKLWKVAARYNPLYEALFADGALFDKFNDIHNGEIFKRGLFYDRINVSDDVLARIIEEMTSHSFRKFDFDILGNTYETYLGNTLYLKDDNTFDLKPSQETRKESGIYYTPPYVVDYIVKNTLGALLKDKTPEQVGRIKVLDPACGSGSFLIKAYDCFANYYEEKNRVIKARIDEHVRKGMLFETSESTHEGYEASILMNNIHGVDLDAQAAEIAAVNLMLKALKPNEMLPPILGETIKVGNSLISGSEEELKKYFGDEWRAKKPFNWEEEFADVFDKAMAEGERGFDVVIGNPPYIRVDVLSNSDKKYWQDYFVSPYGKFDIYFLFIENGLKLLKNGGRLGFIVSNKFLVGDSGKRLREFILQNCIIETLIDVSNIDVFKDASIYPVIIILRKEPEEAERMSALVKSIDIISTEEFVKGKFAENSVPQKLFYEFEEKLILSNLTKQKLDILQKVNKNSELFGTICIISEGLHTGGDEKFIIRDFVPISRKVLRGKDISRYGISNSGDYIDMQKFREISPDVTPREKKLDEDKIVVQEFALRPTASIDYDKSFCLGTIYFATPKKEIDLKYLLAILNSQLLNYLYRMLFEVTHMRGGYIKFRTNYLGQLPIHIIDLSNPLEKSAQDDLVAHVDRMLILNKQLNSINADFQHYLNLRPHSMAPLRNFMDTLPVADKEVLKDAFGRKTISTIKAEKFEAFEILEEGEWLVFRVAYLYTGVKGKTEKGPITRALRLRISDNNMRKFILYSFKDTAPGKLGSGNILEQLQKLKIPRLVINGEDNRRAIEELMTPFLVEVAKKEALEREIKEIDDAIDKKVYALYGLTDDEIRIIEEQCKK
ncbi:MAG: N-6 DNA methylase [Candidatus Methanoperedens sp.]|nr:N-6 DNA methylase [Candidatus Methanoperedens sp.]